MAVSVYSYLFLGLVLFLIGLAGSVLTKNVIKVLISIEFMLLGVNINFVTFAVFCDSVNLDGCILTLFYTGLGAVELAVALYLFYLMFRKKQSDDIGKYTEL